MDTIVDFLGDEAVQYPKTIHRPESSMSTHTDAGIAMKITKVTPWLIEAPRLFLDTADDNKRITSQQFAPRRRPGLAKRARKSRAVLRLVA